MTIRVRLGLAVACVVLAGCAPRVPLAPRLDVHERQHRFTQALRERRDGVARLDAEVNLWARLQGREDPPGASGRLTLSRLGGFRLRVDSPFGTAIDAAGRGDTLVLQVPALDVAAVADGEPRTRDLGPIVYRTLSATWEPPGEAWAAAAWDDSLCVLSWLAGRDSIHLAVGSNGLPARLEAGMNGGTGIEARYERWGAVGGVRWPTRLTVADGEGRIRLTYQLGTTRVAGAKPPFTLRVPDGAERMSAAQLRALFGMLSRRLGFPAEPDGEEQE